MYSVLIIIIPILSFLLQAYPRLFNKYFGVDVWTRIIEADLIKRNHHRIPVKKISDGFILEGYFNYPPVFPWLLSFFPKKILFEKQGFIAPFFDSILNIVVAVIALQMTNNIYIALCAQAMYASIPLIVLENSYLTPRSLGYLNFVLAFYPLLLYSINHDPKLLAISYIFTVLIFFTHKFATQSLFFICIFFTFFDRTLLYVVTFFFGLLTAIIISNGYYFRIYQGHIGNILFWTKNYQYRFVHQVRGLVKKKEKMDFVGQIYFLLQKLSPLALIGTNLWLLGVFLFLIAAIFQWHILPIHNLMLIKMVGWVVFFYIFAICVLSFDILIPIGEGQRYLEMATVPTVLLSSISFFFLLQTPLRLYAIAVTAVIFLINFSLIFFLQWKGIIKDRNRSMTKDMEKIFAFLNSYKPIPRILCIPHQITTMVLYNTNTQVLVDIESGTLQKIQDVFPILRKSVREIAKKYKLNILVLKKDYATMQELRLKKKDLLMESEDTQVIKI